jgi:cysteine desulfurase family protein (TIGR01976 family)
MGSPRLDIDFVRAQFPAFAHPQTGQWAFFENAGGSYAPAPVIDQLDHYMTATKAQPYAAYWASHAAGEAMDRSHRLLAAGINAELDEVSFGPSTTQNTYVLAHALRAELAPGDEVIVTNQDHEANVGAWRRLADNGSGIRVREWSVDPRTGLLDPSNLQGLLSERTKLVCFTHCSNIVGSVNDVAAIARLVHQAGARVVVDGVSHAPHAAVDVKALNVDFYLYSLYKTYGPHQGLLYAKREHLEHIAHQGHYFNVGELGKRLTPAGPQHGEIACAGGIVDYYDTVYRHHFGADPELLPVKDRVAQVFDLFHAHEVMLATSILEVLGTKPKVRVIGLPTIEAGRRAPTIAFTHATFSSARIAERLVEGKIATSHGHYYAHRLLGALGIEQEDGVVRLSLVHYNSEEDVARLVRVLDEML